MCADRAAGASGWRDMRKSCFIKYMSVLGDVTLYHALYRTTSLLFRLSCSPLMFRLQCRRRTAAHARWHARRPSHIQINHSRNATVSIRMEGTQFIRHAIWARRILWLATIPPPHSHAHSKATRPRSPSCSNVRHSVASHVGDGIVQAKAAPSRSCKWLTPTALIASLSHVAGGKD